MFPVETDGEKKSRESVLLARPDDDGCYAQAYKYNFILMSDWNQYFDNMSGKENERKCF